MFKTINLQDIIYASMADDKKVTDNNLYLYLPNLIPFVEIQLMFTEATENNYKISYDQWYTERRVTKDMIDQHDIGLVQKASSTKYLNRAHQTEKRNETPIKIINIAIFDNLNLQKSLWK